MTEATHNWFLRNRAFLVFPPVIIAMVVWAVLRGGVGTTIAMITGGMTMQPPITGSKAAARWVTKRFIVSNPELHGPTHNPSA